MYKTKKEIEDWIKKFNPEQVERMRADNYLDHINDDDLDGNEITFFAVKPAPKAINPITKIHLDLSPESSLFIKLTY